MHRPLEVTHAKSPLGWTHFDVVFWQVLLAARGFLSQAQLFDAFQAGEPFLHAKTKVGSQFIIRPRFACGFSDEPCCSVWWICRRRCGRCCSSI